MAATLMAWAAAAFAQTDEIQVYDGSIAAPGVVNLTWHDNFTPEGLKSPAFPGGLVPDRSLNGVPEWAYGATPWLETGLYLPIYSVSGNRGPSIDGGKVRLLLAEPNAARQTFVYAVNFEFSYNAPYWDPRRFTSEIRPILGVHLRRWDLIANPILDNSYAGGFGGLDFAPAGRVAYHWTRDFASAVEDYSDAGPLRAFVPIGRQSHEVWGVVDERTKFADIETGAGFGVTPSSDRLTVKLMLSRDIWRPRDKSGGGPR